MVKLSQKRPIGEAMSVSGDEARPDRREQARERIRRAGREARKSGKPRDSCRYPNPTEKKLWQEGWDEEDGLDPKP